MEGKAPKTKDLFKHLLPPLVESDELLSILCCQILCSTDTGFGGKLTWVMTSLIERLFVTAFLAVLLCGCGKNAPKAAVDPKAFDAAAPEVKEVWDQAITAAASNDFGSAILTLRVMSRQALSAEQGKTAYDAIVFYESKLREAAKGGDPAATKAMKELGFRTAPGR
jgi:hypothetical protein